MEKEYSYSDANMSQDQEEKRSFQVIQTIKLNQISILEKAAGGKVVQLV